jgi:ABC-type phosphate transport system substrate-binding protein
MLVRTVTLVSVACASLTLSAVATPARAYADTDPGTLVGEGGSFFSPAINKLINDLGTGSNPPIPTYTNVKLDNGIADFVGGTPQIPSALPGSFAADFVVSERPLTSAEGAAATTNHRSFAYVPFAAVPVALATLVPDPTKYQGQGSISISEFCPHIPLTISLIDELYGFDKSDPLLSWSDSRLQCAQGSPGQPYGVPPAVYANADPTMENEAIMSLLDSTPASQQFFEAGLQDRASVSTDTTPSESWPYAQNKVPGGDQPLIGKLLNISPTTNAPDTNAANWALGAIVALSSAWTGAPLGVPWDLPTAAVQNAQGAFVSPSTSAATAAENDAQLASTGDPTTNNLVTFEASSSDATAYNNYLMLEDYLVVPTTGLPAAKASRLAQLVRFVVGPTGQKDIAAFGAAPATAAMVTADLKVAAQLDAEEVGTSSSSSGSGSSGTSSSSGSSGTSTTADSTGSSSDCACPSTSSALAYTGYDPWPLVGFGASLTIVAAVFRRRLRKAVIRS